MNELPNLRQQPMIVAWKEFRDSPEYEAIRRRALDPCTVDAVLWSVFETGWLSRRVVIREFLSLPKEERERVMQAIGEKRLPWYKRLFSRH